MTQLSFADTETREAFQNLQTVMSAMLKRQSFFERFQQFDGDRKMWKVLGYKQTLDFQDYYAYWRRGGLARQLIKRAPDTSWRNPPEIFSDDDDDTWNSTWRDFARRIALYPTLKRADTLSRIGQYGLIVFGVRESRLTSFSEPLESLDGIADIQYLRVFHQGSVSIKDWDQDKSSPRYGKPLMYNVQMPYRGETDTKQIHWTRTLHIAEHIEEDESIGTPALENVFNYLYDLAKVSGAAPEAFWSLADAGYKILAEADAEPDWGSIDENLEAFSHNLIKAFRAAGIKEFEKMQSTPPNPEKTFDMLLTVIGSSMDPPIPKRILAGSERGELASSQDAEGWYGQIGERQDTYLTNYILRPFVNRCMQWGAIEQKPYTVKWPALFEPTMQEQSETALKKAQAMKTFNEAMALGGEGLTVDEFRKELGYEPEEQPNIQNRSNGHDQKVHDYINHVNE